MRAASFLLAFSSLLLSATAFAAEPGFCHSVCDSERRACKADVQQLAAEDGEGLIKMQERNQLARTATKTGAPTAVPVRATEHSAVQNRRIQRTAACVSAYQRCERACNAPASASPVIVPRKNG